MKPITRTSITRTPITRTVAALSVLALLGGLSACGQEGSGAGGAQDGATSPGSDSGAEADGGELADADGVVCPDRLPGDGGVAVTDPATQAPELPQADKAWVCRYSMDDEAGDGGQGDLTWSLDGDQVEVAADALPALGDSLAELTPAGSDRFCTEEIGARWMVVTATAEGDLTGVVVDDFGCGDVRVTDDPLAAAPGEAAAARADGTVAGVLSGPDGLASDLAALHG